MKFTIIVLFALVAVAMSMPTPTVEVTEAEWEGFKKTHNKVYADAAEEQKRKDIYLSTKKLVEEHNKKYDAGEESYSLGINHFADLTEEERKSSCCGLIIPEDEKLKL